MAEPVGEALVECPHLTGDNACTVCQRLAAVVALCDEVQSTLGDYAHVRDVRAAALGSYCAR